MGVTRLELVEPCSLLMKGAQSISHLCPIPKSLTFKLFHQWEQRYGILQVSSFTNKSLLLIFTILRSKHLVWIRYGNCQEWWVWGLTKEPFLVFTTEVVFLIEGGQCEFTFPVFRPILPKETFPSFKIHESMTHMSNQIHGSLRKMILVTKEIKTM